MTVETLGALDALTRRVADVAAALAPEAPELVTPGWVADTYGLSPATVYSAIKEGRLPALAVPGGKGSTTYLVRPAHAYDLWGWRYIRRGREDKS